MPLTCRSAAWSYPLISATKFGFLFSRNAATPSFASRLVSTTPNASDSSCHEIHPRTFRKRKKRIISWGPPAHKHFQMVRHCGWYSSRSRGERNKAELFRPAAEPMPSEATPEVTVLQVSDYKLPRIPSRTWRDFIKKIWEVDPLGCPRSGQKRKSSASFMNPMS